MLNTASLFITATPLDRSLVTSERVSARVEPYYESRAATSASVMMPTVSPVSVTITAL